MRMRSEVSVRKSRSGRNDVVACGYRARTRLEWAKKIGPRLDLGSPNRITLSPQLPFDYPVVFSLHELISQASELEASSEAC